MAVKDREQYNSYMKDYMNKRYRERRLDTINVMGGVCVSCGSTHDLEIDHIDPTSKINTLAKLSSCSEDKWKTEVKKCQLLCRSCHIEKSRNDGSQKDRKRSTECNCGKTFTTTKSYAGHKRWCKL